MYEPQERTRPKLLVVDDSRTMRTIIKRSCVICGVDPELIIEASNGIEALEQIDTWDPELILSDVVMPRLDGLEMMQILSQAERHASVVFITSLATPQVCHRLLDLGALDVIRKPFQPDTLSQVLDPFLNPATPQDEGDMEETLILEPPTLHGFWEQATLNYAIRHVTETVVFSIAQRIEAPLPKDRVLYCGHVRIRKEDEVCVLRIACTRQTIQELTFNLMGEDPRDNDLLLCDSLQELANIVAGELISARPPQTWGMDPAGYEVHAPGALEFTEHLAYGLDGSMSQCLFFHLERAEAETG